MSGINYLVDTNCFIYFLEENPLLLPFAESSWVFSYITEVELLSNKAITLKQDALIRSFLSACSRIGHTQEITELTIKLRRKYSFKLPDAIIVATAQAQRLPILTADKAFSVIKEVDVFLLEI